MDPSANLQQLAGFFQREEPIIANVVIQPTINFSAIDIMCPLVFVDLLPDGSD